MPTVSKTVNTSVTGVALAEEETPKTLPVLAEWYGRAVIDYSDLGSEVDYVADESISASRQNQFGVPVGITVGGGYNIYGRNDRTRDLQGFFFADAHEKLDTGALNGVAVPLTSVAGAGVYGAASGLSVFPSGTIVLASGFTNSANNNVATVTGSTGTTLTTDGATVVEASPPAAARIQQVGFAFGSGDLSLVVLGGLATLNSTAGDWLNMNLQIGEWVFIGGDDAGAQFTTGYGYGRIVSKDNDNLVLDDLAWIGTIASDTGAGQSLRVYAGTYIRNEKDPALIKCRSYHIERSLGNDGDGIQSQYLVGAVASELSVTFPLKERHVMSVTYVALDDITRTGLQGLLGGTRISPPNEKLYNTSSDLFRAKMTIHDPSTLAPTPLFEYATECDFSINNNVTVAEALGVFGGFDFTVGNFVAGGTASPYFTKVATIDAVRRGDPCSYDVIVARDNQGMVYDMPLVGLKGGQLDASPGESIKIPLESFAAENEQGYTMSYTSFSYLPDVAMPV